MKTMGQGHVNIHSLVHIVFVFFLLLNCNSVYNAGVVDYHLEIICCILGLLLFLTGKRTKKNAWALVILYTAYQVPLFLVSLKNGDYIFTYVIKYMFYIPLVALLSSQTSDFLDKSIEYFIGIIYVLAQISLFFYVFAVIFGLIGPTGSYILKWGNSVHVNSFFGVFFECSPGKVFAWKNSAIFTEAPVWASLVALATTFELFYRKYKVRKKYIVVFFLTLITTFSTTAYIYFLLSFAGIIYANYEDLIKHRYAKFIFFIFFLVVACVALAGSLMILKDKSSRGISFLLRADDLLSSFRTLKDHPIFGLGFGQNSALSYWSTARRALGANVRSGQSSDLAYLLSSGGLYFALFYISGIYGIAKQSTGRKRLMVFGLIMYVFIISRVGSTLFFIMLFTCGFTKLLLHSENIKMQQRKLR